MGKMNANLVRPAGLQPAGEEARHRLAVGADVALDHLPVRHRFAAALADGALLARMRVAVEWGVDGAARTLGRTPDQRQIVALDRALALVGELIAEPAMGAVVLGHHHQAGGVLVEPMNDAGPLDAADPGQAVAAMGDQRVDQRAAGMPRRRVHDEARRLVEHDQRIVLVDDVERDCLGRGLCRLGLGQRHSNNVAGIDRRGRIADCARLDRHLTGQDQRLQSRARQRRDLRRQHAVEPPPAGLRHRHRFSRIRHV